MSTNHKGIEYDDPKKYFPYITHRLDVGKDKLKLLKNLIGKLFSKVEPGEGDNHYLKGSSRLFNNVTVKYSKKHAEITKDPNSVQIVVARHKSLFDFVIHQPTHHDLINRKIIIVAGSNLFVHKFNYSLRFFGGFMFLRDDVTLKHKGLPNAFLTKANYLKHVLPEYLKSQVFCKDENQHDMLVYLEYEKDRVTGKSNSGRTKSGKLRDLNWSFLKLMHELANKQGIKLYITPVNVSLSKVPDVPYICHPTKLAGKWKNLRYLTETRFVFQRFADFTSKNVKRKVDIVVNYGEPECFSDMELETFRDFRKYSDELKSKIGDLEAIFPINLICLALGDDNSISLKQATVRMTKIYQKLKGMNIILDPVNDKEGNMRDPEEIIKEGLDILNRNPNMYISDFDPRHIMSYTDNTLHCNDAAVKTWYNNMLEHLFKD